MVAFHHDPLMPARAAGSRLFGRWQLARLLGKSERTMAWLVLDPADGRPFAVVMPRRQPGEAEALLQWQAGMRISARVHHPQLAVLHESGVQDGWPYAAYDLQGAQTLVDAREAQGMGGADAVALAEQLLQGLAYAHDAGLAHQDLQPYLLLRGPGGELRLAGLGVAELPWGAAPAGASPGWPVADAGGLQRQRAAAEQDVLAAGVLLHTWLTGQDALDEPDIGKVLQRLPPVGREVLTLPWQMPQPLAEPLRAIVNRATQAQERLRYLNARTLLRALQGWQQTEKADGGGPLALLAERLRVSGVLPAAPGAELRTARLLRMERERTSVLADIALEDPALSFELLRLVNTAQVRGAQLAGSGPVLTLRRAIAMLGLAGVRRATQALRAWPGPLQPPQALALRAEVDRSKRAARLAVALRPAGYDAEVIYLVTLLQCLGRLVARYHFAEEAAQIDRLMQPVPASREGESDAPGLSEAAAAHAVLGADLEAIGLAVARQWGLDDTVLHLIHREAVDAPVHVATHEDALLRSVASCAIETVDALQRPAARVRAGLQRVASRYARALDVDLQVLQQALQDTSGSGASAPISTTRPAPLTDLPPVDPGPAARPGLRRRALGPEGEPGP